MAVFTDVSVFASWIWARAAEADAADPEEEMEDGGATASSGSAASTSASASSFPSKLLSSTVLRLFSSALECVCSDQTFDD